MPPHHEAPELWFISLADLMSLLFAFFVLLTSASAAPKNCAGLSDYLDAHRAQYKNFELRSTKAECRLTLPSDFLFQSGQDQISSAGLDRLRPLFQEIHKLKEHAQDHLIVEGYTDNVPIHTRQFASNWELSSARATNVANFMRSLGLPHENLSVRGYAENRPLAPYTDDLDRAIAGETLQEARRKNRRVEIILVNPPKGLEESTLLFH